MKLRQPKTNGKESKDKLKKNVCGRRARPHPQFSFFLFCLFVGSSTIQLHEEMQVDL